MTRKSLIATLLLAVAAPLCTADTHPASDGELAAVLAAQPEQTRARYVYRHPLQTLEFFGIEPGMTVVEALPGGGWYTRLLLDYLGPEGCLIGADYAADMFPLFGFFSPEQLDAKKTWVQQWTAEARGWAGDGGAQVRAFQFGSLPDDLQGTADAVLMIRALHNLARFESQGAYLSTAIGDAFDVLRPGGIVGVVQHLARDEKSDEWASGARGYLKDDFVIRRFTDAGFELVGMTDINFNEKDQPGDDDVVWRLPPTLATSRDDPELRARMEAIGESHRMTLKFRKPDPN